MLWTDCNGLYVVLCGISDYVVLYVNCRNVLSRFLEAAGRGIWENPDEELLSRIREELEEIDSEIEGVDV